MKSVWLNVELSGLPANIELDAFVIQVPNAPFGLSWYQGDIESDEYGYAKARFVGRFNVETFIIAPGVAPAPQVHYEPTADAAETPATAPVHTFHIGIWFNSADDAKAARLLGLRDAVQWRATARACSCSTQPATPTTQVEHRRHESGCAGASARQCVVQLT